MIHTLTLVERHVQIENFLSDYIYVYSQRQTHHDSSTTVRSWGITVSMMRNSNPYICKTGIYNMVTGETRFSSSIATRVLEMIKAEQFAINPYFSITFLHFQSF